ncbi:MAG: hypothetical protein ABI467_31360 [Kofleriaceae bacterium]
MRALCVVLLLAGTASAKPADAWLGDLTDRVIADLAAGKPLVVEVHAPLCERTIIACGNQKLGDGDNPDTNLYWSTTPGFGEWFARRGGGWKRVLKQDASETGDADILAVLVYRRTVTASAAWVKRGAPHQFELDVVIHGWRGKAIDRALAAYADDVSGKGTRELVVTNQSAHKTTLEAGGAAQLVAFVGHNRLMDLDTFTWPEPGKVPQGAIAIACDTAPYMKQQVSAATRVPLLMTSDLLFANAAPLEAAVLAFASGGGYAEIRKDAATAYAKIQQVQVRRVWGTFTNPSDRRW